MQQLSLSVSWMGTSHVCPQDAERELADLRAVPMLRKGKLETVLTKCFRDYTEVVALFVC